MGITIFRKNYEMGILSTSSKLEDYIENNYITYIFYLHLLKKSLTTTFTFIM